MKIGIVTSFPPSKVTLNEYAYHLVKNFVEKEEIEEVVLFCDKTKEKKVLDFPYSEKVTIVECWKFNSYTSLFRILKSIKSQGPSHVLFNLQFMKFGDKKVVAALGLLAPMLTRLLGVKNTVLIHNILETVDLSSAGFTNNPILKGVYNTIGYVLTKLILCANQVAVTIPKYKRILESKYKAGNVVHIPHGTFEIPELPNYKVKKGTKQVMAFGKFGTYKKVETLIEAVKRVRQRIREDIEVVIAGTSNPNTPNYLKNVQEQYKHLDFIRFTGYVEEEDVQTIFNEAAIVAFPYTSTTGSSGVLHQAGSYGKATILPNIGDLKELITDEGYTGEFFNPLNVESLANAIQVLVLNDVKRIQIGKQNYRAATAYPMSKICDKYIEVFNNDNLIAEVATL
ncbi:glycosyltransferase [Pseudofulvibacter geojedonensis]|uniref:Glycosyltransferase n=1 Tax=Pseudofulvibacter geojedonensis TaxID=1123758 RepID=A0ABW3I4S5_9FLAO